MCFACVCLQEVCQRVAFRSKGGGRRAWLGIVYDEVCRKAWARRAYAGDVTFDIEQAALRSSSDLLKDAEDAYDTIEVCALMLFAYCCVRLRIVFAVQAAQKKKQPEEQSGSANFQVSHMLCVCSWSAFVSRAFRVQGGNQQRRNNGGKAGKGSGDKRQWTPGQVSNMLCVCSWSVFGSRAFRAQGGNQQGQWKGTQQRNAGNAKAGISLNAGFASLRCFAFSLRRLVLGRSSGTETARVTRRLVSFSMPGL